MIGFVRSLRVEKRFGFIRVPGISGDYFFHKDDYLDNWDDLVAEYHATTSDVHVEFEGRNTPKGPRADNVRHA